MSWLRSADASMVWAMEIARICLLVFGCAAGGWAVGFGMGYRRGVRDAITHDIASAAQRRCSPEVSATLSYSAAEASKSSNR
jgi:hypothetical protein